MYCQLPNAYCKAPTAYFIPTIKLDGPGRRTCPDVLESRRVHPGRILLVAVSAARRRSHQHIEGEERALFGRGLVRFQDEVLDHHAAWGFERFKTAPQQILIFGGTQHVANGGDEDQGEAFA